MLNMNSFEGAGFERGRMEDRQKDWREDWQEDWIAGWKKGWKEGLREGRREILEIQLTHRFGVLPASVRQRISEGTEEELSSWAMAVLDAPTLESVFSAR